jgi:hypothetical protein
MDRSDIQKKYPEISAAANDVLGLLGPAFTKKPEGHVETDIAAAASLAGVSMLRGKGFDVRQFTPGTMILTEMDTEMNGIWDFMMAAAGILGLDPDEGWDREIPPAHKPIYSVLEMTKKTEKGFLEVCRRHQLTTEYFPYIAILAALKLVYAANKIDLLDHTVGKALTGHHVVAGAKTVPHPLERE